MLLFLLAFLVVTLLPTQCLEACAQGKHGCDEDGIQSCSVASAQDRESSCGQEAGSALLQVHAAPRKSVLDEESRSSNQTRLETALQALKAVEEQPVDDAADPDLVSGATAALNQAGYKTLASICCPIEMDVFVERLANHLGFTVCDEGSLHGLVAHFYHSDQRRKFEELVEDMIAAADGECAWLGVENRCPKRPATCASFPQGAAGGGEKRSCSSRKAVASNTTKPSAPTAAFKCNPAAATRMDFAGTTVSVNNLGGAGPGSGAQEIRYKNIVPGATIDLVVTALGSYVPSTVALNGKRDGLGQISLKSGNAVELKFQLQDTATKAPVKVPEWYFTILDIDQNDNLHRERFYVKGFAEAIKEGLNDFETDLLSDGRTIFKSQQRGMGWDDPDDPSKLAVVTDPDDASNTVDQRKRAVMLVFRDQSEFTLTYEVTQKAGTAAQGRPLIFAGSSNLLDICPKL